MSPSSPEQRKDQALESGSFEDYFAVDAEAEFDLPPSSKVPDEGAVYRRATGMPKAKAVKAEVPNLITTEIADAEDDFLYKYEDLRNADDKDVQKIDKLTEKQDKSQARKSDLEEFIADDKEESKNEEHRIPFKRAVAQVQKFSNANIAKIRQKRIDRRQKKVYEKLEIVTPEHEGTDDGKSWKVVDRIKNRIQTRKESAKTNGEDYKNEAGEIVDIDGWLDSARKNLAGMSAKSRFSVMFGKQKLKRARSDYESAFAAYAASEILTQQEADGEGKRGKPEIEYDDETFREIALQLAVDEIKERAALEHEYALNSRRGSFLRWYGSLSMTKKILLGGAVGVGAGAVGAVAGGIAAVAIVGGARVGRMATSVKSKQAVSEQANEEFRAGAEEYYVHDKLSGTDLQIDAGADTSANLHNRAAQVAKVLAEGSQALNSHDRKRATISAGVAAGSAIGGYVLGKVLHGVVEGIGGRGGTGNGHGSGSGSGSHSPETTAPHGTEGTGGDHAPTTTIPGEGSHSGNGGGNGGTTHSGEHSGGGSSDTQSGGEHGQAYTASQTENIRGNGLTLEEERNFFNEDYNSPRLDQARADFRVFADQNGSNVQNVENPYTLQQTENIRGNGLTLQEEQNFFDANYNTPGLEEAREALATMSENGTDIHTAVNNFVPENFTPPSGISRAQYVTDISNRLLNEQMARQVEADLEEAA